MLKCWKMLHACCFIEIFHSSAKYLGHFPSQCTKLTEKLYKTEKSTSFQRRINDKPIKIAKMVWHRINLGPDFLIVVYFGGKNVNSCRWQWFQRYFLLFQNKQFTRLNWSGKKRLLEKCRWNYDGKTNESTAVERFELASHIAHVFSQLIDRHSIENKVFLGFSSAYTIPASIATCQRHTIFTLCATFSFPKAFKGISEISTK